jgi:hypothetical protein
MLLLEKRLVLLVTFLGLGLLQYWAARGIRDIGLPSILRVLLIMGYVVFTYTVAAEMITPYLQRTIRGVHGSLRQKKGAVAGVITALAMLAMLFWGYYSTYASGG